MNNKIIITSVVSLGSLLATGCTPKRGADAGGAHVESAGKTMPRTLTHADIDKFDAQNEWRIDSFEDGVFTLRNRGITYRATCGRAYSDDGNTVSCISTLDMVGHVLTESPGKESDGSVYDISRFDAGIVLDCRSSNNNIRMEYLQIISAKPDRPLKIGG